MILYLRAVTGMQVYRCTERTIHQRCFHWLACKKYMWHCVPLVKFLWLKILIIDFLTTEQMIILCHFFKKTNKQQTPI